MLDETIMRLRQDVRATDQLKAQALFETTAEVLNGLVTAYDHFKTGGGRGLEFDRRSRARLLHHSRI